MVNINNLLCVLIELPIYCFMLIELILKVSVDELYWNWLNYMLLLRNGELEMNIDNVFAMWIVIEKWWIESEYDELLEINWLVDNWLICVVVDNDVNVEYVELRNEILNYVDDERMIWAIEIVDLKFVELDWIDELCELFVFDGNELVV